MVQKQCEAMLQHLVGQKMGQISADEMLQHMVGQMCTCTRARPSSEELGGEQKCGKT